MGWFTSLYPVRLDPGPLDLAEALAGGAPLGRALKTIKEQLRAVPGKGLGYGLLRYLNGADGERLPGAVRRSLASTIWGGLPGAGAGADLGARLARTVRLGGGDPAMPLAHLIEINALTLDGADGARLVANWIVGACAAREAAVRDLAEGWFRGADGAGPSCRAARCGRPHAQRCAVGAL